MLSIIAGAIPAILGVLTSSIPTLVGYLEKGQVLKHEIELTKLRMEAAREGLDQSVFIEAIKASNKEAESLRDHDMSIPSNGYIDFIRASVRPFITYTIFLTFITIKGLMIYVMLGEGMSGRDILETTWDSTADQALFAILGFWFGNRAFIHYQNRKIR